MSSKTKRVHLPKAIRTGGVSTRLGFSNLGRNVPAVIKNLEQTVEVLKPHNRRAYIESQQSFWANDYPYRGCHLFLLEDMSKVDDQELSVASPSDFQVGNSGLHDETKIVFFASYKNWALMISQLAPDFHTDFTISVFSGSTYCFHPLEARNQILTHHSEEVYEAWKRKVKAEYPESIKIIIDAAKKQLKSLTAWSPPCCPSSERLLRSTPGITVKGGIAYLIF